MLGCQFFGPTYSYGYSYQHNPMLDIQAPTPTFLRRIYQPFPIPLNNQNRKDQYQVKRPQTRQPQQIQTSKLTAPTALFNKSLSEINQNPILSQNTKKADRLESLLSKVTKKACQLTKTFETNNNKLENAPLQKDLHKVSRNTIEIFMPQKLEATASTLQGECDDNTEVLKELEIAPSQLKQGIFHRHRKTAQSPLTQHLKPSYVNHESRFVATPNCLISTQPKLGHRFPYNLIPPRVEKKPTSLLLSASITSKFNSLSRMPLRLSEHIKKKFESLSLRFFNAKNSSKTTKTQTTIPITT